MPKLTLSTISSRYASVAALNANFDAIVTALENTLSRNGTSPNTMSANLDMSSNRILNLPDPVAASEPVTKGWAEAQPTNAAASAADAADSADAALASEVAAAAAAAQIVGWEYEGTWTASRAYAINNIVTVPSSTYEGWSFICLVAHTSGAVFATDYSAGRWGILAKRGAAGAGTGDMIAANNLSDVTNVATARTNLGGTATGVSLFTAANAGAARSAITAASSGANSDITSLTGLTTALSRSQGGTGVTTAGTSGNVLQSDGTNWSSVAKITLSTAQLTTSGVSKEFTGIPSWVKRIVMTFNSVSTAGANSDLIIQLGSTTYKTSGYISSIGAINGVTVGAASNTSGFLLLVTPVSYSISGVVTLSLYSGNTWAYNSIINYTTDAVAMGAGIVAMSGVVDRIKLLTANGTDTFDAGAINITYE